MNQAAYPVQPARRRAAWRQWLTAALAMAAGALLWEAAAGSAQEARVGVSGGAGGGTSPGAGTLVVAGQITRDTYGLYLVDPPSSRICVYLWVPGGPSGKLKLVAARNYTYDLQLNEYNTELLPGEIKKIVDEARAAAGGASTRPN